MKILLINKYHYLKGGAERSYFDTAKILTDYGHKVAFYSMKHPENRPTEWSKYFIDRVDYQSKLSLIKKIKLIADIFYNFSAKRKLRRLIIEFKPEVAHLHNIYHQLSPSIISLLKKHKIPVVMTLHDYKLICPNYNLYANGKIWEKSRPDKYYKVFFDKAVKNSYLKSLVCALEAYWHRFLKIYDQVDIFISPSRFLIAKFKDFGFENKIIYLPPAWLGGEIKTAAGASAEKYILYFGRLSEEKGIEDLLKAFSVLTGDYLLYILGDGPSKNSLQILTEKLKLNHKIRFIGHKTGAGLSGLIGGAEFIVLPSRWYENAPYSVIEAMAMGKAVICPDLGGLPELIKNGSSGILYESGNIKRLAEAMESLISHPEIKQRLGAGATKTVKMNNDKNSFYNGLIEIYDRAIEKSKN